MQQSKLIKDKIYTLLDFFQDGIFVVEKGLMVYANKKLQEMLGYSIDEIIGNPFGTYIHEEDRALVAGNYEKRQLGYKTPDEYEFRLVSKHGSILDVRINVGTTADAKGLLMSIGTLHDITERKQTMQELVQSKSDIQSILDNMPDVFYRTDKEGIITMISPSAQNSLGYAPQEMLGVAMSDFYYNPAYRDNVLRALQLGKGKATQVEAALRHKDGSIRWISTNAYIRYDKDQNILGVEGIARDITEHKMLEEKLIQYSQVDDLTQVYNRRYFLTQAEKQLSIAKRYERPIAVMMLDLDSFKKVNDTHGHKAGDMVLTHFTQVCQEIIRRTDIMGRLGGEEFAILLPETDLVEAEVLAERIRKEVNRSSLDSDGKQIKISTSIGLYIHANNEDHDLSTILNKADQALYQAKEQRNCVKAFQHKND
ncbi:MAG: diguanylate cyclase [Thiovulaceae bacterium]|nr:diguanylate cyclase [Sulfurimonadaceae bacterium]